MKIKVTLGMENYTGDLCGFKFENSICFIDDDGSLRIQRLLIRLQALFAGTQVELAETTAPVQVPTQEANPDVPVADSTAPATPAPDAVEEVEEEKPRRRRAR